jgi:hypothetical protein
MSKSLMTSFICCGLATILSGSNAWSQTSSSPRLNSPCQNTLEVIPAERLTFGDLSKLGQELTVAKGNFAMTFWPLEPNHRAEKAGKKTLGVSLIQTRDIERPPVGLKILSTQSDDLDFVKNGSRILIGSRSESTCPIRAILSVTETGGVVLKEMGIDKAH